MERMQVQQGNSSSCDDYGSWTFWLVTYTAKGKPTPRAKKLYKTKSSTDFWKLYTRIKDVDKIIPSFGLAFLKKGKLPPGQYGEQKKGMFIMKFKKFDKNAELAWVETLLTISGCVLGPVKKLVNGAIIEGWHDEVIISIWINHYKSSRKNLIASEISDRLAYFDVPVNITFHEMN